MGRKTLVASLIALFLLASATAFGASGDKAKTGETLIVKSRGQIVTVVLTDDTKTQDKKGLFGLDHPTAEQVAANMRTLETHQQAIARHEVQLAAQKQDIGANQQNIAANKQQIEQNIKDIEGNTQRFMALSDYDVKGEATVKFAVGSSEISPPDQEQVKKLAQTATGLKGYIIEVTGYADSTGSAAMNIGT